MLPSLQSHESTSPTSSCFGESAQPALGAEIWEVCCSPRSSLTVSVQASGGAGRRLTLPEWDFTDDSSGARGKQLAKRLRPRRVWVSIPCTAVSQMLQLSKKNKSWKRRLRVRLAETRVMLRNVCRILRQVVRQGGQVYYEWPAFSRGWKLRHLQRLKRWAAQRRIPLYEIRIDGCTYNLRALHGQTLLRKPWLVLTNDASFESLGRVCSPAHRREHPHEPIQGSRQTEATAYYPAALVHAIARHWGLQRGRSGE